MANSVGDRRVKYHLAQTASFLGQSEAIHLEQLWIRFGSTSTAKYPLQIDLRDAATVDQTFPSLLTVTFDSDAAATVSGTAANQVFFPVYIATSDNDKAQGLPLSKGLSVDVTQGSSGTNNQTFDAYIVYRVDS